MVPIYSVFVESAGEVGLVKKNKLRRHEILANEHLELCTILLILLNC